MGGSGKNDVEENHDVMGEIVRMPNDVRENLIKRCTEHIRSLAEKHRNVQDETPGKQWYVYFDQSHITPYPRSKMYQSLSLLKVQ